MPVPVSIRVSAILAWIIAVGFGLPCLIAIRSLAAGRGIAYVMGYPTYGNGPFQRHGVSTTIPLVSGFLVVCLAEAVAGWLLWRGSRTGAWLSSATMVPGAIYWWGFALPFPPIFAAARTLLILVSWRSLR